MYRYGRKSKAQLSTVHPYLQLIMMRVLLTDDHSIDQGGRSIGQQQAYFDRKASKLRPPKGKHLMRVDPTRQFGDADWAFAVDACPYIKGKRLATSAAKFGPDQRAQFAWFLRRVEQEGHRILDGTGWKLRFGINWDGDAEILHQKFNDFFHIEMIRTEKPFFPANNGMR